MLAGSKNISAVFTDLRQSFNSGRSKSLEWRKNQLKQLYRMCEEQENVFASAVNADFHRPHAETLLYDCAMIRNSCNHALNNIDDWVKDDYRSDGLAFAAMDKYVHHEPYGISLIIGAWNYPYLLSLSPLVGAIAAGNCAIIKPSELAPNAAAAMQKMVAQYLDPECIRVVLGGADETGILLKGDIDHVFYTGSTNVGKIVMRAAAEKMIPVVLECGGKSPVYVADDANVSVAAKRIAWGKAMNCGQTCLAPDYILCSKSMENRLIPEIKNAWKTYYTDNPLNSESYCHIVNDRHYQRVKNLIVPDKVVHGGQTNDDQRYIAPTIMTNVEAKDKVMQEEIFGPILPFLTVNSEQEAIDFINRRSKPLALYVFSSNKSLARRIIDSTSSGSSCVNDVIFQIAPPSLPFGGVGESGLGNYHGKYSFETFSHSRSVVISPTWIDGLISKRNPPYDSKKTAFLASTTKVPRQWIPLPRVSLWFWAFLALLVAVLFRKI